MPVYEHLLKKSRPLDGQKSAAATDVTVPPQHRRVSNLESKEKVGITMMTSSYQRHLLLNLQQQFQRSYKHTAIGNYIYNNYIRDVSVRNVTSP